MNRLKEFQGQNTRNRQRLWRWSGVDDDGTREPHQKEEPPNMRLASAKEPDPSSLHCGASRVNVSRQRQLEQNGARKSRSNMFPCHVP